MIAPFLHLQGLHQTLGRFNLGPIDLALQKNEYLILLGPTGCGKSSLLQVLAGLAPRHAGRIVMDGRDLQLLPPDRRKIGYVIQGDNLFPHLTVEENITFGLRYTEAPARQHAAMVREAVRTFGLTKNAGQSVVTLSGGERRKVALARSLIIRPKLLLLDEPLSMLDHNGRIEMLALLRMLHETVATTTIHVTHDREEAWTIAQNCAVMHDGCLEQSGTVDEVFRKPASLFVAGFTGGTNLIPVDLRNKTARTPWGDIALPKPPFSGAGHMLVRPESVHVASPRQKPLLRGKVVRVTDFGKYFELMVTHEKSGVSLIAHTDRRAVQPMKIAATTGLWWDEADIHFIPEAKHA